MLKAVLMGICLIAATLSGVGIWSIYTRDKDKFEPKLWIGFFDYRLNFRDVGASLNQCLGRDVAQLQRMFRSNRYFSGWSCDKVGNPEKIYSLNFSPWNPHAYYCMTPSGKRLLGLRPNTTIEITEIEDPMRWEKPAFRQSMCWFFRQALDDIKHHTPFLYHCDMGRDRTGAFTGLLLYALVEQKHIDRDQMKDAIECDYEKTRSLEKEKRGHMQNVLKQFEQLGGVSSFLERTCNIPASAIAQAADEFF